MALLVGFLMVPVALFLVLVLVALLVASFQYNIAFGFLMLAGIVWVTRACVRVTRVAARNLRHMSTQSPASTSARGDWMCWGCSTINPVGHPFCIRCGVSSEASGR